ncbi:hypothetical protein P20439_3375 [Pseudoalteromonas sp. BSi20439]|nr:hypothetical protein P20439_3375 [Pseudoalteromonas sp. BSi20439]
MLNQKSSHASLLNIIFIVKSQYSESAVNSIIFKVVAVFY